MEVKKKNTSPEFLTCSLGDEPGTALIRYNYHRTWVCVLDASIFTTTNESKTLMHARNPDLHTKTTLADQIQQNEQPVSVITI